MVEILNFYFILFSFIPLFGNNSLLYPIKLARLPPHSVTVCEFIHEVHILQTPKFNTRCGNVFWIDIRKKNPKVSKAFLRKRHISDVTTTLFYLLLLISSFWTEFSKHVYTLNLDSNALNMHMTLFSLERSMQQGV